jgi:proline iminopeptidase
MYRRADDPFHPFYPAWNEGRLEVGDGHTLWFDQAGNKDGIPMVLIHGGPGGYSVGGARVMINPDVFHTIMFDQRGVGQSMPKGSLENNTLQHTLKDMEKLREHLGLERWLVAGGSWGSTVSLAYAQAYPERCLGVLVTGVWLANQENADWLYNHVKMVFPEIWEEYVAHIPEPERGDLRAAYASRILGDDPVAAEAAAVSQYLFESTLMYLEAPVPQLGTANAVTYGRIFAHYAINDFFLEENQLLRDAHRIAHLPTVIVGSRYDMCTPFKNAWDLHKALPDAELMVASPASHMPTERTLALIDLRAMARMGELLSR